MAKPSVVFSQCTREPPEGPGGLIEVEMIPTNPQEGGGIVALQQGDSAVQPTPSGVEGEKNRDPGPGQASAVLFLCPGSHCLLVDRFKNGQGSGLDGGQYRVYINGTLEIRRARPEDEGTYTCVASSMLGTAENQVRLEVKGQSQGLCERFSLKNFSDPLHPSLTIIANCRSASLIRRL